MSDKIAPPVTQSLKEVLERRQIYTSGTVTAAMALLDGGVWGARVELPSSLQLYCFDPRCAAVMLWDKKSEIEITAAPKLVKFFMLAYECRHCRSAWIRYHIATDYVSATAVTVLVYGLIPRQYPGTSHTVAAALDEVDLSLYQNAIICREHGMGLGALAYLRRVVEEAIDVLLELLADVLKESEDPKQQEYVAQVAWLKSQKAFDKKAVAAAAVLPRSFFAGGHNPFARLHEWASGGVHNASDEECCEVFDEIRDVFDALFERLASEREARRLYAERLGRLSKRVPKSVTARKDEEA